MKILSSGFGMVILFMFTAITRYGMAKEKRVMFFTLIKSMWSSRLLPVLVAFPSFFVQSQIIQTGRIEVPIQMDIESYLVVSLDTSGIALYRSFIGDRENQLELVRLDTALHQVWNGFLPVAKGLSLANVKANDGKIYFFYKNQNPGSKSFTVFVVAAQNGSYFSFTIKNLIQFNATEFIVSKDAILIGGYFNFR